MEIPISLKLKLARVAPCVFIVALGGCAQAPRTLPDTREADLRAVRETDAAKMRAWADKDADKIAFFFADDATHFSPNMPALKGRQSIRETFKERQADPSRTVSAEATSIEVSRGGDLAYVIGVYTATSTDPKTRKVMTEKGRYVTVYEKQPDGSWKGVVNMDNAEAPASAR